MALSILNHLCKFIAVLFICSSLQAQSVIKDKKYLYDDFSKGLNTKLSPSSLPGNQAVVAENVRFSDELKSLSKRDEIMLYGTADASEAITGMHRLYLSDGTKKLIVCHGDEIEVGDDSTGSFTTILDLSNGGHRWQWITWHDLAIGTDGYNPPVKYDGTSASATYLGSCLALDSGVAGNPNGTYKYKVTFYTSSYEVSFDTPSNTITVSSSKISLSMIPIAPDSYGEEDTVGRKVYRTTTGGSTYYLLTTIADNTTTTYTDDTADGSLGAALSPDDTYAPPKCRFLEINNNRLFMANDPTNGKSRVYYSEDGSHEVFIDGNYLVVRSNDGDEITFLKNLLGTLTAGKNNTIQKIYTDGDDPDADWAVSDPFSFIGCQAPYTASNSIIGLLYLGRDGLYRFNGQSTELISDAVTPEILDISPSNLDDCWGVFHRNKYYLAYTSEKSGATYNNRVLVYDILADAYSIDTVSLNAFCSFNSGTDWGVLYSGASDSGKVYAHSKGNYEVRHRKHADFTGTFVDARYIPTAVGGDEDDPIIEIASIDTIDALSMTIDNNVGTIDRGTLLGTYTSQSLEVGASSLDKLYWNEDVPSNCDVKFYVRGDSTLSGLSSASWSSAVTDPSGSDISSATTGTLNYIQYKAELTTPSYDKTPTLYKSDNYVVRLTYNKEGTAAENSVDLKWESGWSDYGYPGHKKALKKVLVYYDCPAKTGTLNITFENLSGDTDSFSIDLSVYNSSYYEYFSNGVFSGEFIKLKVEESSLNDFVLRKVIVVYDVEPLI